MGNDRAVAFAIPLNDGSVAGWPVPAAGTARLTEQRNVNRGLRVV
jgi:hypothetical protein